MHDTLISWLGLEVCTFAGSLSEVLGAGSACFRSQAWNMGFVFLGIVAVTFVVLIISARRRKHRDNFYR